MDSKDFNRLYWKHYLSIEEDFIKTNRYVEVDKRNFQTFSVEYVKLLQLIGSEFDVVSKEICRYYGYSNKKNIYEYASIIIPNFTEICSQKLMIKNNSSIIIGPLSDWTIQPEYKSPKWWESYNKIKHDRVNKYDHASLENVLLGLASLYLVEMYFIYEIALKEKSTLKIPNIPSSFFEIIDWKAKQHIYGDGLLLDELDDTRIIRGAGACHLT